MRRVKSRSNQTAPKTQPATTTAQHRSHFKQYIRIQAVSHPPSSNLEQSTLAGADAPGCGPRAALSGHARLLRRRPRSVGHRGRDAGAHALRTPAAPFFKPPFTHPIKAASITAASFTAASVLSQCVREKAGLIDVDAEDIEDEMLESMVGIIY